MTEAEWTAADSLYGLDPTDLPGLSHRKFFLFLAGFLPRALWGPVCPECQAGVRQIEVAADHGPTLPDWFTFDRAAHTCAFSTAEVFRSARHYLRGFITTGELWNRVYEAAGSAERGAYGIGEGGQYPAFPVRAAAIREVWRSGLITLRDVVGNPFRPVAFDPIWRTSDTVALARGIYEDRAFTRLPLLADALMDADCDSEDVLAHCRSDGPHVLGCWVVDLVLGKE